MCEIVNPFKFSFVVPLFFCSSPLLLRVFKGVFVMIDYLSAPLAAVLASLPD